MNFQQYIKDNTQDAILWLAMKSWRTATSTIGQDLATKSIVETLITIPQAITRDTYIKNICAQISKYNTGISKEIKLIEKNINAIQRQIDKASDNANVTEIVQHRTSLELELKKLEEKILPDLIARDLTKFVKDELDEQIRLKKEKQKDIFNSNGDYDSENPEDEEDPWLKCPKWMDAKDVKLNGFTLVEDRKGTELKRYGYYTYNPNEKSHREITNFSITPIFHIKAGRDSHHMIEIYNGYKRAVLDVESKAMVSSDLMQHHLVGEGNFVIYANKTEYLRIASSLLQQFRECYKLNMLGWQPYGFYAFVDRMFIPGNGFKELDEWGVAEMEDKNFIIPASSAVYKSLLSTESDPYENDRPLVYIEPTITFDEWAGRMTRVYAEKGTVGVAYCILAAFRDIAFAIDNNFPHLYAFGERSSGKSKWAESLNAFFFKNRPFFNLNSGTDFAFFKYMGHFRNCISGLNEFDEKVIKPEWFQSIKGVFDGESRQRGSMAQHGKVETMKVESGLLLIGQYLVTMDDNSVVTRSIIEAFSERNLSDDDKKEYNQLKDIEAKGITGLICQLLEHRQYFKESYKDIFNHTISQWRAEYHVGGNFNQRIFQNWAHLYTAMLLASSKISIPSIDIAEFKAYCFNKAGEWCRFVRSSDTLSEFWNTLVFLAEGRMIAYGWDYRIKLEHTVTIRHKDETSVKNFTEPVKVLYLRFNNVHKLYQESYKKRTGKEGMSIENLMHYCKSRPYFIGPVKSIRWDRKHPHSDVKVSSGIAFLYDELGLDLQTETDIEAENTMEFKPPDF